MPADSECVRFELNRVLRRKAAPGAPPVLQTPIEVEADESVENAAALALEAALQHQAQLADTAQAIAGGNLARDVQVSSEEDTLGVAFSEMLAGLRRLVG